MPDVRLIIDGKAYGGWKDVSIGLGIEQIAGSFELGISEVWRQDQTEPVEIRDGAKCSVLIDDETVITGWVDEIGIDYDDTSHRTVIRGRDASGDLVDCAAVYGGGEWKQQTIQQIARDLCAPFGIKVYADPSIVGEPFPTWSITTSESVFENIDRMCQHRALLALSDGKGNIQLSRAGSSRTETAIILGENVKAASGIRTSVERFSEYTLLGQRSVDDLVEAADAAQMSAIARDLSVKRYRPHIIISEGAPSLDALSNRATWERNVRAGRASKLVYTVAGWRQKPKGSSLGALWKPNSIVPVRDKILRVKSDYLITKVQYKLSEEDGETTQISCALPEAFDLIALPERDDEFQL